MTLGVGKWCGNPGTVSAPCACDGTQRRKYDVGPPPLEQTLQRQRAELK